MNPAAHSPRPDQARAFEYLTGRAVSRPSAARILIAQTIEYLLGPKALMCKLSLNDHLNEFGRRRIRVSSGARECSATACIPFAIVRSTHLSPVGRLTLYAAHSSVFLNRPLNQSFTKRFRSSIAQVSVHGIGKPSFANTL
jgi:hypothetical protein